MDDSIPIVTVIYAYAAIHTHSHKSIIIIMLDIANFKNFY